MWLKIAESYNKVTKKSLKVTKKLRNVKIREKYGKN